jgi:ribA/ribD-fused uncharacterized protein
MDKIDSFFGKYRFLSNFFPSPIVYDKIYYPTVEHAFQAQKTLDIVGRKRISLAASAADAKHMGKLVDLRKDWETVKLEVMEKCLRLKFEHEQLKQQLLDTGDAELIEGNTWNDTFWGVCGGVGLNHLGKLLMKIREELKGK